MQRSDQTGQTEFNLNFSYCLLTKLKKFFIVIIVKMILDFCYCGKTLSITVSSKPCFFNQIEFVSLFLFSNTPQLKTFV